MNEHAGNAILTTGGFRCRVCGACQPAPATPLPLTELIRILRAFDQAHATCQPAPVFKPGDKVIFPLKNKDRTGTVDRLEGPNLLIRYHGGNFILRRATAVRHAPLPEPSLPTP